MTMPESFFLAYIDCALWSSTDNADDTGGAPLSKNCSMSDIAPETLATMRADCEQFYAADSGDIGRFGSWEQAGHDFWLTRNGHGAGFWDGDWPEPAATRLDKASKAFGGFDLYIGDDGAIHGSRC